MRMRDFRGIFCDGRVKMSVFDIFLSKKACFFKRIDKAYAWLILGVYWEYLRLQSVFLPFWGIFGIQIYLLEHSFIFIEEKSYYIFKLYTSYNS